MAFQFTFGNHSRLSGMSLAGIHQRIQHDRRSGTPLAGIYLSRHSGKNLTGTLAGMT